MKRLLLLSALIAAPILFAQPRVLTLWPGTPPGDTVALPPEANITKPTDRQPAGRPVTRIAPVSVPTVTVYAPDPARNTGAAVLVCPGGAYRYLAIDVEGTEVCDWLNSIGVTGLLLKYRVPRRPDVPQWLPPLQDAQRAMGLVRLQAKALGIDPHRIGIIGFSAGADLAAELSTHSLGRIYGAVDAADRESCRPDFAMVIYPGYLVDKSDTLAPELRVRAPGTPPTFLVQAEDDPVRVENAVYYYLALKQAGVPAEMHLYPVGGHGYGLRRTAALVTTWPDRAAEWMRASGFLRATP